MTQIHVVIRRINPAFKIDLVQVGRIKDGQFAPIPLDAIANSPISSFLENSSICDSLYVEHSKLPDIFNACGHLPGFNVEFFDNTIVILFDFNIDCDESTSKEEGKRDEGCNPSAWR